ncbi:DUF2812 domain-containing protein [Oscillibacter valericigenes]|uniref:DUF2812 domain-containing protein n=1 Tax=Oscillibacter valericigenes TaxID=351091 RepID=UPI001F48069D|nr:DUF2812 domain-containing protein [Oscillibacter valericigenes]MCF2616551.1 DUF2812 domain-containing protein [Oscillibacter valericigenes]
MLRKKREYILYSFYDRTGMESHLEQMAARGWMVEKMGRFFWTYHRAKPKAVHFSVIYFAPASEFDCGPGEEQQTFQDYCAEAGWTLAASWSQMLIFSSEAEAPTPIETDAAVQVEAVHRAMKKNFLISYGILLALSLFQLIRELPDFWRHPTDSLANPGFLSTLALWPLVSLLCAVEIASYFLWRRKARRIADEEGRFTPTQDHRRLRLTFELLSDACLLSLFFSVSPRIALLLVIVLVVVVALQGLLAGLRYLLRRTGWTTEVNRLVTQILSFLVALAIILGVNRGAVRLVQDEPWRETYTWQGGEYDVHPIDLPLTLEDLTGESYEHVSRDLIETRTYFLSRLNCREVVGQPQVTLSYTVTDIRRPWLRDTVIQDYLENTDLVGYISTHKLTIHRSWEPEDPTAWGADAAYRRYFGSEHAPSGDFLLLYGDRIVEFEPNRELTDAQRAVVGKKLAPHT